MLVGGMIDDLGFSEQQAGYVAAIEGAGLVLSSLVTALWIRKVSWTKALAVMFIVTAAVNAVSANLDAFMPFLLVRFLAGFSAGTIFALTVAALGDNKQPDRAFGIAQIVQGAEFIACRKAASWRWTVSELYYMLALPADAADAGALSIEGQRGAPRCCWRYTKLHLDLGGADSQPAVFHQYFRFLGVHRAHGAGCRPQHRDHRPGAGDIAVRSDHWGKCRSDCQ
jgi:hypothetical protein